VVVRRYLSSGAAHESKRLNRLLICRRKKLSLSRPRRRRVKTYVLLVTILTVSRDSVFGILFPRARYNYS
jgi:hypothetical protein